MVLCNTLLFLSIDAYADHNKVQKYQHPQTFDLQHVISLQECNVFDLLLRDGGDSHIGDNEIDKWNKNWDY